MTNKDQVRIAVIGTSGSGKSTLAKKIAAKLNIKYIEQDHLFWLPNWQEVSKEQFAKAVLGEISADSWSICGNHSTVQENIWGRATHVIWLNYPLRTSLLRGFQRTLRRVFLKEECCNGNREGFSHAFLSKNSILWWILKTNKKRNEKYSIAKEQGTFSKVNFLEFKNPREADRWLINFKSN